LLDNPNKFNFIVFKNEHCEDSQNNEENERKEEELKYSRKLHEEINQFFQKSMVGLKVYFEMLSNQLIESQMRLFGNNYNNISKIIPNFNELVNFITKNNNNNSFTSNNLNLNNTNLFNQLPNNGNLNIMNFLNSKSNNTLVQNQAFVNNNNNNCNNLFNDLNTLFSLFRNLN